LRAQSSRLRQFQRYALRRGGAFLVTTFQADARFDGAVFEGGDTSWTKTTFTGAAGFEGAAFRGFADFRWATFVDGARFDRAVFTSGNSPDEAQVLNLDNTDIRQRRTWPDGWIVRPDPADPTRGTLARVKQAEEPEPAAPSQLSPE
jgi:CubicO group peptidase (beta-lactamase class C family)